MYENDGETSTVCTFDNNYKHTQNDNGIILTPTSTLPAVKSYAYPTSGRLTIGTYVPDDLINASQATSTHDLIMHEFGHAIGIGTLWNSVHASTMISSGQSGWFTETPQLQLTTWKGKYANDEYRKLLHTRAVSLDSSSTSYSTYDAGIEAPIETALYMGGGSAGGHFSEHVFDNLQMSPIAEEDTMMESITKMLIASLEDMGVCVNYDAVWDKYVWGYNNSGQLEHVISESNIPLINSSYTLPPLYLVSATIYSPEPQNIYLEFSKNLHSLSAFEYSADDDSDSLPQQGIILREESGDWRDATVATVTWTSAVSGKRLVLTLNIPATEDVVSANRLQLIGTYNTIEGIYDTEGRTPVGSFTRVIAWEDVSTAS